MNILFDFSNPIDEAISKFFLEIALNNQKWVNLMTIISCLFVIFFIFAFLFLFKKENRWVGILMFVSQIIGWVLVDYVLKKIFCRDRPFLDPAFIDLTNGEPFGFYISGYSFPSGHSVISTCGAYTFFFYYLMIDKRKTKSYLAYSLVFIVINLLIMLSRIALLHHYFTDCLAGFVLGLLISLIVVLICKVILHLKERKQLQEN